MPFTPVQNKGASQGAATTHAITLDAAPKPGNLLVGFWKSSCTNSLVTTSNAFTNAVFIDHGANSSSIWYKLALPGESATITWGTTSVAADLEVVEFSGNSRDPDRLLDKTASFDFGASTTTSISLATGTLNDPDSLICSTAGIGGSNGGSEAINNGFTIVDAATLGQMTAGYRASQGVASVTPSHSWLTARTAWIVNVTFRAARPTPVPRATMRGRLR